MQSNSGQSDTWSRHPKPAQIERIHTQSNNRPNRSAYHRTSQNITRSPRTGFASLPIDSVPIPASVEEELVRLRSRVLALEEENQRLRQENEFLRYSSTISTVSAVSTTPTVFDSRMTATTYTSPSPRESSVSSGSDASMENVDETRPTAPSRPAIRHSFKTYRYSGETIRVYDWYDRVDSNILGRGRHGVVVPMFNRKTAQRVAVKKNKNVFRSLINARHIFRELRVLAHMHHENIVQLVDVIVPNTDQKEIFEDVCMVFEMMETTLAHVILHADALGVDHIKYFVYQILCGLHHMHSAGIMHRDIKQDNILVNAQDCILKICDFGMARPFILREDQKSPSEYDVVAQWYRAPELLCHNEFYGPEVDIWALGCIMSELVTRNVLFEGAVGDPQDQLRAVFQTVGFPDDLSWVEDTHSVAWIKENIDYVDSKSIDFSQLVPRFERAGIEFFQDLVAVNPSERPSANALLQRAWLEEEFEETHLIPCRSFELPEGFDEELDTLFSCKKKIYSELRWIAEKRLRK